MNISSIRTYAKKIENTKYHDEKLLFVIHGLIDLFAFSRAALFTYSELTKKVQGVFRVNPAGLFHIHTIYETLSSIPPIHSVIQKKQVTYIKETTLIRQIPAKYLDGVSEFVIVPISFGSTTIGFLTASNRTEGKLVDDQLLHFLRTYGETVEKALQHSNGFQKVSPLSRRETQVLQRIAWGESIVEIADNLNISKHTVQGYVKSANKKLNTKNRTESIAKSLRKGFIK